MPKQQHISIREKCKILDEWREANGSTSMRKFAESKKVCYASVSRWIGSSKELYAQLGSSPYDRCRVRGSTHEQVDNALLQFFRNARAVNATLSGPILKEKANKFASELGISDWTCSDGWLSRWKKRHDITFKVTIIVQ